MLGKTRQLHEFGHPVTVAFRNDHIPAEADERSGYVRFTPPSEEALVDYYENEYAKDNPGYYSVEADYAPHRVAMLVGEALQIAQRFGAPDEMRIHEIGCSFGGLVAGFAARGHHATGSDINGPAVATGQRERGNTHIFAASNADALTRIGSGLDMIYASHVLEHDPRLGETLTLCRSVMSERSLLIAGVPNAMYLRAVLDGFVSNPWTAYPDHLHMLSPGHIGIMCDDFGFEPLLVLTRGIEDNPWMRRHFGEPYDQGHVRSSWAHLTSTFGLGQELFFVLTPKDGAIAHAHPEHVAAMRARLSVFLEFERATRDHLKALPYG